MTLPANEGERKVSDLVREVLRGREIIEGRSKARTITAENICEALYYIEIKMHHITKKAMNGTKVEINLNAQEFPGSYRFDALSTWFTAEFDKNHWSITEIKRDICGRYKFFVELSDTAKEAILKYYDQFD